MADVPSIDELVLEFEAAADDAGQISPEDFDRVLPTCDADLIERVLAALDRRGIQLREPHAGPPVIPSDYRGPRIMDGGRRRRRLS